MIGFPSRIPVPVHTGMELYDWVPVENPRARTHGDGIHGNGSRQKPPCPYTRGRVLFVGARLVNSVKMFLSGIAVPLREPVHGQNVQIFPPDFVRTPYQLLEIIRQGKIATG
jgi:hypothetical protein